MKQYKDKNWLYNKYSDNKLSIHQIEKLCNCDYKTIWYWLQKFNILRRSIGEGLHLRQNNHCNLSNEARQWIDGELLGDACLHSYSKYSALFTYGSKYLEYTQYISDTLNSFGIKQAGKINKIYHKEIGHFGERYTYNYASCAYEELLSIRKRWYLNKKKIIPKDLKLCPILLRQEFIGDGYLCHRKNRRPRIQLSTDGFSILDVEWLVEQLNKLGFKSTRRSSNNTIGISAYSTKDFLNYIGKCPVKCYQYKFNY